MGDLLGQTEEQNRGSDRKNDGRGNKDYNLKGFLKGHQSLGNGRYIIEVYRSLRESLIPLLQNRFNWGLKERETP